MESSRWTLTFSRGFTPTMGSDLSCAPQFAWNCVERWTLPVYDNPDALDQETGFLRVELRRLDTSWECDGCVL